MPRLTKRAIYYVWIDGSIIEKFRFKKTLLMMKTDQLKKKGHFTNSHGIIKIRLLTCSKQSGLLRIY